MRSAFLAAACLAAAANAQVAPPPAPGDALPLLREVAEAARATKTWRVEGSSAVHNVGQSAEHNSVTPLKLVRDGLKWRYEGGIIQISDGVRFWTAAQPPVQYMGFAAAAGAVPPDLFWDNLPETLPSAMLVGEDTVEWNGASERCEIVRAEIQRGQRSLWIDRERKLVLRDETETTGGTAGAPTHYTRTITLTAVERDFQPPPDGAEFRPPANAAIRQGSVPSQAPVPGPEVFKVGGGVTAPTLWHKVEPEYSETARRAGLQGTVVLYVEVGPDGRAHNIQVVRSLGMGLDEKAIEAVQKWTFLPGKKDGVPVSVQATTVVNFRLLKKP